MISYFFVAYFLCSAYNTLLIYNYAFVGALCPQLANPKDGRVKFTSAGRSVGAQVWYVCNDGFTLMGSESRRCQSNLEWSLMAPTCQPNLCPRLENPKNGDVKSPNGRSVGAKVWYVCDTGFSLVGSESRRCQSNLQWSLRAPTCQPNQCPILQAPENGKIKSPDGRSVGAEVWYICNTGFTLVGSESRRCQNNRQWSLKAPTCEPNICPRLTAPQNGQIKFSDAGRSVGAKVQYQCDQGFKLVGTEMRLCQNNLRWSSQAPVCKRKL